MITAKPGSGWPGSGWPGSGWPVSGPDGVVMARLPWSHLPSPFRRETMPDCEVGAPPDIRAGCVVGRVEEQQSQRKRGLMMKAIRTREPAGISGLVYEEVPDPTPMIGDVLVKVAAAG